MFSLLLDDVFVYQWNPNFWQTSYSEQSRAYDVEQFTDGWHMKRETVVLLCWGPFIDFAGMVCIQLLPYRESLLQVNAKVFWLNVLILQWNISILMGVLGWLLPHPQELTEQFEEYENDVMASAVDRPIQYGRYQSNMERILENGVHRYVESVPRRIKLVWKLVVAQHLTTTYVDASFVTHL